MNSLENGALNAEPASPAPVKKARLVIKLQMDDACAQAPAAGGRAVVVTVDKQNDDTPTEVEPRSWWRAWTMVTQHRVYAGKGGKVCHQAPHETRVALPARGGRQERAGYGLQDAAALLDNLILIKLYLHVCFVHSHVTNLLYSPLHGSSGWRQKKLTAVRMKRLLVSCCMW